MISFSHNRPNWKYSFNKARNTSQSFWSPFEFSGSENNSVELPPQLDYVVLNSETSAVGFGNSFRAHQYAALQEALQTMSNLPDDNDFYVIKAATDRASEFLAVLSQNYAMDPPKIMPQDGEAIVFTWQHGDIKLYMTVDPDHKGLMEVSESTNFRCVHRALSNSDAQANEEILNLIGARPTSSSLMGNDA